MRQRFKTLRRLACGLGAVAMASMGVVAVSSSTAGAAVTKTTITFAELPGAPPNYIFPFVTFAKCSVSNIGWFQNMMYRSLYSFGAYSGGTHGSVTLNKKLSLAKPPTYSKTGKTVTIKLKTYTWSNGEKVDATDVIFYFNMLHEAKTHSCYWAPDGIAIPTSVKAIKATGPSTVKITLTRKFNEHWFTYDELSQVTPFPMAWDITKTGGAPNSGGCAKAAWGAGDAACKKVFDFLSLQAGFNPTTPKQTITALGSYATSPIWSTVDGPFKLTSFGPTAPIVMVPNPTYSGPNKPTIKKFIEKPFATTSAMYNAEVAGTIDVGGLPIADITSPATAGKTPTTEPKTGKNNPRLSSTFNMATWWLVGITYSPVNFKSTSDTGQAGPIISQAYFRQALQRGVNQPALIKSLFKGYAVPTYGPVPVVPPNPYASSFEKSNPFAYNVPAGRALLKSHGWKINPGGTDTCQKPGTGAHDCGKGIKKGAKLDFTFLVASSPPVIKEQSTAEKDAWSAMGINVRLSTATFNTVIGTAVPCKKTTAKSCKWEMANWGAGWVFAPDFYPTGEEIFATGAGANGGSFNTATANKLIHDTNTKTIPLTKYENYLTKATPVLWNPEAGQGQWEIHKGLKGVTPFNPFDYFTAATWHWKK